MGTNAVRLGIVGAGRMGLAIINSASNHDDVEIGSVWVRNPETVGDLSTPSGALITWWSTPMSSSTSVFRRGPNQ